MFPLFGRVFSFVQSDVADKERILQEYIDSVCSRSISLSDATQLTLEFPGQG